MSQRDKKSTAKKNNLFDNIIADAMNKSVSAGFQSANRFMGEKVERFFKKAPGAIYRRIMGIKDDGPSGGEPSGVSQRLFKETDGVPIGYVAGTKKMVYLPLDDWKHKVCQGGTGAGKTSWGANYVIERAKRGLGSAYFDCSDGKATRWILNGLPKGHDMSKVVVLDNNDEYNPLPIGFYVDSSGLFREDDLVSAWLAFFVNNLGVEGQWMTQELIVHACKAVFAAYDDATMLEVIQMVEDPAFRQRTLDKLNSRWYAETIQWWNKFSSKNQDGQSMAKDAFLRRAGVMTRLRKLKHMVCQRPKKKYEYKKWMDEGYVVLIYCDEEKLDSTTISCVMSMHLLNFWLAALSRGDEYDQSRVKKFHILADEPQTWLPGNQHLLDDLYSKGRRHGLTIISMVQGTAQIENVSKHLMRVIMNNNPDIIGFKTNDNTIKLGDFNLGEINLHQFVARIGDNRPFLCRGLGKVPFIEDRSNFIFEQRQYWGKPWIEVANDIDRRRGLIANEIDEAGYEDSNAHRKEKGSKHNTASKGVLPKLSDSSAPSPVAGAGGTHQPQAPSKLGRTRNMDRKDLGVHLFSLEPGEEGDSSGDGRGGK